MHKVGIKGENEDKEREPSTLYKEFPIQAVEDMDALSN